MRAIFDKAIDPSYKPPLLGAPPGGQARKRVITNDQIEEYLIHTELPYEQVQEGMWLIHDENDYIDNIVVIHTPPVITFRVKLLELSAIAEDTKSGLFQHLLTLNAGDMVAGAYGIEGDSVVIIDSLQSENLDYNEFQASIDSITLSIREHYPEIRSLIPSTEPVIEDMSVEELEESIRS